MEATFCFVGFRFVVNIEENKAVKVVIKTKNKRRNHC